MATTTRGRSSYGGYSSYLFGSGSNPWGGGYKKSSPRKNKNAGGSPTAYRNCCNTFEQKIDSYRTLCTQAQGPSGSWGKPSPSTLNSFANWINKGAIVQTVSKAQVSRWARSTNKNFNPHNPSPTACKNVLAAKFGRNTIKAVCCTKSGSFMVVTSPTVNGRCFCFPK
jgi:hypothetical protein